MLSYLEELTIRLAQGVAELPEPTRTRHAEYFLQIQQPDGGFAGRQGGSDLYYTGFALRALAVLGQLQGDVSQRAADYLRSRLSGRESIVDFMSLIYGAALLDAADGIDVFDGAADNWRELVVEALGRLRCDDGGYAKGPRGVAGSTYHTFLVVLCFQLLERPLPHADDVIRFVHSQANSEGGFREIRVSKRAGTNPTAAAVATLRILNALPDDLRQGTIDFLVDMQTDEGGLRANTRIPVADLLSTFTGSLTLIDLNALDAISLPDVQKYVHSLQRQEGGFHGALWDTAHDVEYAFYGLGCLALLGDSAKA